MIQNHYYSNIDCGYSVGKIEDRCILKIESKNNNRFNEGIYLFFTCNSLKFYQEMTLASF